MKIKEEKTHDHPIYLYCVACGTGGARQDMWWIENFEFVNTNLLTKQKEK